MTTPQNLQVQNDAVRPKRDQNNSDVNSPAENFDAYLRAYEEMSPEGGALLRRLFEKAKKFSYLPVEVQNELSRF